MRSAPSTTRSRSVRATAVAVAVVLTGGWMDLAYALSCRLVRGNADDANTVLAGRDLVHGNLWLHGWHLPPDTFWTGDVPLAGLLGLVTGLGPVLIHLVPVVLAASVLALGLWCGLASGPSPGLAALPVILVLALPTPLESQFWLQSPMHVATIGYCLIGLTVLSRRPERRRWALGVAALALAGVGDATAWAIGVVPVVVVGLRALPASRRRGAYLLGAALASVVAAQAGVALVHLLDGWHSGPLIRLVPVGQWPGGMVRAGRALLDLTGASAAPPFRGLNPVLHWVHVLSPALLLIGVGAGLWSLRRPRTEGPGGLLGLSALGGAGQFCLLAPPGAPAPEMRYLLATLVMGSVAAGVALGRVPVGSSKRAALGLLVGAVAAAYAAAPLAVLRHPPRPYPAVELSRWLASRHLEFGVGTYWTASYLTLMSAGRVVVRPVVESPGGLRPYGYFASEGWWRDPRLTHPQFLVLETAAPWGGVDVDRAQAELGRAELVTRRGPYTIVVWPEGSPRRLAVGQ